MNNNQHISVFVGLSGGVDSSVAAALLVEQGYDVTGVYMKNWSKDLPGFPCPWKEDYQDAKRVAVKLGIKFELFDFEKEYFDKVVTYMLDGFKSGITPNPDVMCNQEIKFKLFYDVARSKGADYIATGHYARVQNSGNPKSETQNPKTVTGPTYHKADGKTSNIRPPTSKIAHLLKAVDDNKDQTYFLYRISEEALAHTLFPIGHLIKPQVREEASKWNLITATKKESMGICFVGSVGIREFLSQFVESESGPIIDQDGKKIGTHDGAIFYTIGQRHGLDVGGGLPYYVTNKDMKSNTVYVTNDISDESLWAYELILTNNHWINQPAKLGQKLHVRTRHRAKLITCEVSEINNDRVVLNLSEQIRAITPGQSAVLYDGEICIGGGIIF